MTNIALAVCLVLEAGGEGRKGMEAVREVVAVRAAEARTTETQVVLKRKAFSCFNGISFEEAKSKAVKHPAWGTAQLLSSKPPETDWTKKANHYCTLKTEPYWATKPPVAVVGNHKFFKL